MHAEPAPIIPALDTSDPVRATAWAEALAPHCAFLKLGLEFFVANGPGAVAAITQRPVFLDLKFHDIPNTVAGAVRSVLPIRPALLTIHASGGAAMIAAARKAAEQAGDTRPKVLAVTVLTSLDAEALHQTGVAGGTRQQVLRLARLAIDSGADGLVCSPQEVALLRDALGDAPLLVVPGIRPAGSAGDDQARTMTPAEAMRAGASYLVIGRPITGAADPARAAAEIAAEIRAG